MSNEDRDPVVVIDKMIEVSKDEYPDFVLQLQDIKTSAQYRAPELQHLTWETLQEAMHDVLPSPHTITEMNEIQKKLVRILTNDEGRV